MREEDDPAQHRMVADRSTAAAAKPMAVVAAKPMAVVADRMAVDMMAAADTNNRSRCIRTTDRARNGGAYQLRHFAFGENLSAGRASDGGIVGRAGAGPIARRPEA